MDHAIDQLRDTPGLADARRRFDIGACDRVVYLMLDQALRDAPPE